MKTFTAEEKGARPAVGQVSERGSGDLLFCFVAFSRFCLGAVAALRARWRSQRALLVWDML